MFLIVQDKLSVFEYLCWQVISNKTGMHHTGKIIIVIGLLLVLAGIVVYFAGDKLNWLGRLPGDIRVEKENFKLYIPLTTMLLISVVLSVLIRLFQKFF
jgi:hypothetical protein